MASQYDLKGNPPLLKPWTKWMRHNVLGPIGNGGKPVRRPLRSSPAYSHTPQQIQHNEEPPSPEKLLPMLTKDDKYYLIGQKLSCLLSEDQQKRLIQDAIGAGKLPPTNNTNAGQNCICPDIMVELQTLIRAEFDLVQSRCLTAQAPTVVIHQPTFNNTGFEKPLPGLPAPEWQVDSPYSQPYPYLSQYNYQDPSQISPDIVYHNTLTTIQLPIPESLSPPKSRQNQNPELTSLRFPKIGPEPYLRCAPCDSDHPTRLFSITQRRLPPSQRRCIAREGYVRLCAHKVVTWDLVEACLMSLEQDQSDLENSYNHKRASTADASFFFKCQHPSHLKEVNRDGMSRLPEVVIFGETVNHTGSASRFGQVVLRWTTTRPACNGSVAGDVTELFTSGPEEEDIPYICRDIICPGPPPRVTLTPTDNDIHPQLLHISCRHNPDREPQPRSHAGSRLSCRTGIDTISSYSPSSSYISSTSSYHLARSDSTLSMLTDLDSDCQCAATTSTTPTTAGNTIEQPIRHELTIQAVDLDILRPSETEQPSQPDQQPSSSYTSPSEPGLQRSPPLVTTTETRGNQINPSPEWFAALHPDSYSLDKWAKEGLFGLRWCTEPGCKSYMTMPGFLGRL